MQAQLFASISKEPGGYPAAELNSTHLLCGEERHSYASDCLATTNECSPQNSRKSITDNLGDYDQPSTSSKKRNTKIIGSNGSKVLHSSSLVRRESVPFRSRTNTIDSFMNYPDGSLRYSNQNSLLNVSQLRKTKDTFLIRNNENTSIRTYVKDDPDAPGSSGRIYQSTAKTNPGLYASTNQSNMARPLTFSNQSGIMKITRNTTLKELLQNPNFLFQNASSTSSRKPVFNSTNFPTIDPSSISLFDDGTVDLPQQDNHHQMIQKDFAQNSDTVFRSPNSATSMSPPMTPQQRYESQPRSDDRNCYEQLQMISQRNQNDTSLQRRGIQKQQVCTPQLREYLHPSIGTSYKGPSQRATPYQRKPIRKSGKLIDSEVEEGHHRRQRRSEKTGFTYHQLAIICIINTEEQCCTVGDMYPFLFKHFAGFENNASWNNSLRHALNKRDLFEKVEGMVSFSSGAFYRIVVGVKEWRINDLYATANRNKDQLEILKLRNPDDLNDLLLGKLKFIPSANIVNRNPISKNQNKRQNRKSSILVTAPLRYHNSATEPCNINQLNRSTQLISQIPEQTQRSSKWLSTSLVSESAMNSTNTNMLRYNDYPTDQLFHGTSVQNNYLELANQESRVNYPYEPVLPLDDTANNLLVNGDPFLGVQGQEDPLAEYFVLQATNQKNEEDILVNDSLEAQIAQEYMDYDLHNQEYEMTGQLDNQIQVGYDEYYG